MMPATLFVMRCVPVPLEAGKTYTFTASVGDVVYIVKERMADFNNLRDAEVGEYRLVGRVKLTIQGPGREEGEKAG